MADACYARHLNAQRLERVYEIASPPVRRYLESEIAALAAAAGVTAEITEVAGASLVCEIPMTAAVMDAGARS